MSTSTPSPSPSSRQRLANVYHEFPSQFWVLVGAAFIDRLGGAMLFPFFTLYLTKKFGINMTQVGLMFGVFAMSSVVGTMVGGALTDRLGRKRVLIFSMVMNALTAVLMGIVNDFWLFMVVVTLVGMLADAGAPAQQALVADLLPEEKRSQGYGILRVVFNFAVVVGPLIGGLLASYNYLSLFIADAIASSITAIIVFFKLHETYQPKLVEGEPAESMGQTFVGYFQVLRDTVFVWFLVASALMALVYLQMNTTLAVYLRDQFGVNEQGFSYILALNAGMVVLFQFPITRRIAGYRPLYVMAVGTLLYALGFAMYGVFSLYLMFLLAMVIITIGEMLVSPTSNAIAAKLAPEEMRGRYMAVYGFSWVIPFAIGPLLAGLVLDNLDPRWLWIACGVLGVVAAAAFYMLEQRTSRANWLAVDRRLDILEKLEEGKISAQDAGRMLEKVSAGAWARLAPEVVASERRHLHITVSDMDSGMMKTDLRLPVGLVDAALYHGSSLGDGLDERHAAGLRDFVASGGESDRPHQIDADGERVEVKLE